jgi:hypothetical protein
MGTRQPSQAPPTVLSRAARNPNVSKLARRELVHDFVVKLSSDLYSTLIVRQSVSASTVFQVRGLNIRLPRYIFIYNKLCMHLFAGIRAYLNSLSTGRRRKERKSLFRIVHARGCDSRRRKEFMQNLLRAREEEEKEFIDKTEIDRQKEEEEDFLRNC